ncbi:alpha-L-rhamnosidase [Diaminobutyricimonas aerilata]|uniref:alpha-L-rhamnosidase n=1 Tax=Diaminobutyricimonas aerilata TaxID=1162967 RepID=A0A2M9CFD6_9MICO|nr:family 78 glycoside hydrolase catalytic domain [Diaminobutyricimonas aerilata]PJJ70654.1 alpha-L-rhamnosidase [Diaminobutyricimonas aerilata]
MTTTDDVRVIRLRAGRRNDGAPVADARPRLSWIVESDRTDWVQASAEIDGGGETANVGGESVAVEWPFAPLEPREQRTLRVRVTGADGSTSAWSEPVVVTAGHLGGAGWQAPFIGLAAPSDDARPALARREFVVDRPVRSAYLYSTAQGVHQVEINGTPVDDGEMKPGWTSYQHRLLFDVADVTSLIHTGANAIGIDYAGGWFTEIYGFREMARPFYGPQPSVSAQLVLTFDDGAEQVIATDDSWTASEGPRTASGIYAGEHYDARLEMAGWSQPGFDAEWPAATIVPVDVTPAPRAAEPVRRIETVPVAEVITTPSGATVLDFGQNLVGRLRITVHGPAGSTVTLRHAEVLEHGELGLRPLRAAAATDSYTLRGEGLEVWEPKFTFHGFRYAQVDGWPGDFAPHAVEAVVLHSDMRRTGWFETSHPLVNRLHENVVWGMRGNFLSLPTDCPQRDERLGWTGDIQVFTPTASYLFDCDAFLSSWLEDLALEQAANDGVVPFVVPDPLPGDAAPAAAWGDAATVVPTALYERFANRDVLETQYDSMRAWADALLRRAGERMLWEGEFQFGDWLDPDAPPEHPADAKTDPDIVASAYLYRSTRLVADTAALLGRADDAERYAGTADRIRDAFVREYVTPAGRMLSDAPTAYAVALRFGIVQDATRRQAMGDRLAELVRAAGFHMSTGFVGTPLIQDALVEAGHVEVARRLLLQRENPSWLYAVTMGATTIWERWDSMLEDGSINPGEMTSFNHYAFGAVADWLHRAVGGLAPAEPGYRAIDVRPLPLDGLDWARTAHETPYGLASVEWRRAGSTLEVDVVVPAGVRARVQLPGAEQTEVGSGHHRFTAELEAAAAERAPITLDTPLDRVVADESAYEAVIDALTQQSPEAAREFRRRTKWIPQRTLRNSFVMAPQEHLAAVEVALVATQHPPVE